MENLLPLALSMLMGLLWVGLAIPHIKGKIPPNNWCGFRTKKTLSNEKIWYKANKYMGKELFKAGLLTIVMTILLFIFKTRVPAEFGGAVFFVIITLPVTIAFVKCMFYLKKL